MPFASLERIREETIEAALERWDAEDPLKFSILRLTADAADSPLARESGSSASDRATLTAECVRGVSPGEP
jgi:hypothetical protein